MLNQPLFYGKGGGGGGHVAAVALVVDLGLAHNGLAHQVIHIHSGQTALADHNNFVVAGHAAAQAVDLLGVRGAHDLDEDIVPLLPFGQVTFQEHAALAGAAPHEYGFE